MIPTKPCPKTPLNINEPRSHASSNTLKRHTPHLCALYPTRYPRTATLGVLTCVPNHDGQRNRDLPTTFPPQERSHEHLTRSEKPPQRTTRTESSSRAEQHPPRRRRRNPRPSDSSPSSLAKLLAPRPLAKTERPPYFYQKSYPTLFNPASYATMTDTLVDKLNSASLG